MAFYDNIYNQWNQFNATYPVLAGATATAVYAFANGYSPLEVIATGVVGGMGGYAAQRIGEAAYNIYQKVDKVLVRMDQTLNNANQHIPVTGMTIEALHRTVQRAETILTNSEDNIMTTESRLNKTLDSADKALKGIEKATKPIAALQKVAQPLTQLFGHKKEQKMLKNAPAHVVVVEEIRETTAAESIALTTNDTVAAQNATHAPVIAQNTAKTSVTALPAQALHNAAKKKEKDNHKKLSIRNQIKKHGLDVGLTVLGKMLKQ